MTNTKATKRAFLGSAISLLLCVAMLIGSTFAWFTDSASTGVNSIIAGNLDIKLSYKNAKTGADYQEVSATTTDLFVNKDGNSMLWEPGAASICYFKLENIGNLALKYEMSVNAKDIVLYNGNGLSNVLKSAVVELGEGETLDNAAAIDAATAANATSVLTYLKKDTMPGKDDASYENKYFAMVVYMPTDADNTYNVPAGETALQTDLSINLFATQKDAETDSYGSDYDADTTLPTVVKNDVELKDAITNIETGKSGTLVLSSGTYEKTMFSSMKNKDITFKGEGADKTVIDFTSVNNINAEQDMPGATLVFENVTVKWLDGNYGYQGLKNPKKVVYKNCTIEGTQFMYSGADFTDCNFKISDDYSVYTRAGGDYTFTNCTFETGGRAIMMYNDVPIDVNITLNGCTFSDDGTYNSKDKAAVETGDSGNASKFNIELNNCQILNGFEENNSTSPLWGNKDGMPTDRLNVVIDGKDVY